MARPMTTAQIMERLGGEAFIQRLAGQILAVANATDETGQPGKVTLTVKTFKPKEAEAGDLYTGFETGIAPTYPKPKPHKTGLYVSEDGLFTSDPRQTEIEGLRAVEQGQPQARDVSVGQPEARSV